MTTVIYIGLFLASCAYAVLLAKFRHLWEPHLTWLEVVIGTALCLSAPYLNAHYVVAPADWAVYEQDVWIAFLVGGAPVVIWQLLQSIRAWLRVERRIGSRHDNAGHTPERGPAVAAQRRHGAKTDD